MLYINDYDELLDELITTIFEEDIDTVSYVGDEESVRNLMIQISANTCIIPDVIDFNTEKSGWYILSIDKYEECGELTYSIMNAVNSKGDFYGIRGFVFIDNSLPSKFEKDFDSYDFTECTPLRVSFEEEVDEACKKCTYNCKESCCLKNKDYDDCEIEYDEEGKAIGFVKTWGDNNSKNFYSYYSTSEDDIFDKLKRFD